MNNQGNNSDTIIIGTLALLAMVVFIYAIPVLIGIWLWRKIPPEKREDTVTEFLIISGVGGLISLFLVGWEFIEIGILFSCIFGFFVAAINNGWRNILGIPEPVENFDYLNTATTAQTSPHHDHRDEFQSAQEGDHDAFGFDPAAFGQAQSHGHTETPQGGTIHIEQITYQKAKAGEQSGRKQRSKKSSRETPYGFDKRHPDDAKFWAHADDPSNPPHVRKAWFEKALEREEARRKGQNPDNVKGAKR